LVNGEIEAIHRAMIPARKRAEAVEVLVPSRNFGAMVDIVRT
jgi:hypothetical protein